MQLDSESRRWSAEVFRRRPWPAREWRYWIDGVRRSEDDLPRLQELRHQYAFFFRLLVGMYSNLVISLFCQFICFSFRMSFCSHTDTRLLCRFVLLDGFFVKNYNDRHTCHFSKYRQTVNIYVYNVKAYTKRRTCTWTILDELTIGWCAHAHSHVETDVVRRCLL